MTEEHAAPKVVRNDEEKRYEAWVGDELAGVAVYRERADRTVFTHTEVDSAFEGRGIAKALAAAALDDVVRRGRVIVPLCPFVTEYLKKHTEYEDHIRLPEGAE
jgi:predicted GNAT family acetyltransferase